jgi:hypothetical protein
MSKQLRGKPAASQRLTALAALLTAAAAVVLVLVGVARNVLVVVAAVLSLMLCVFAGWYVVSRRGTARVVAGVVMAAALALLIACLIFADVSILRVTLAGVLAAASVASAHYALRRTRGAPGLGSRHPPAAPARHPVLIMNMKSGGGKA